MNGPPSGPTPLRVSMTRHAATVSNWSAGRGDGSMTCPILLPSVNHSAPSGPAVRPRGGPEAVGIVYSEIAPAVLIRPILWALISVNHSAPSGPAVMPPRPLDAVGTAYSVIVGPGVARPILLPL